ncbi:hypothetical protein [Nonomuraea endophytica]|uniref:Uncharacterized protein n=1 Tax=Nonomuraea endophytica TaxID=714136 RepID=A0A7W8ADE2_9ACTN|nr:hypothetical protein [Nonomuraea endophytica]MBB5083644.1 hypothetical protein [Nonomuraea endophytica]
MIASVAPAADLRADRHLAVLAGPEVPALWAADLIIDDLVNSARPAWPTFTG